MRLRTLSQAARQGHMAVVDELVQAGATLGGVDSGYVEMAINNALLVGDQRSLRIWARTGAAIPDQAKPVNQDVT